MLRIFKPVKIQRLRPGLNPQTWVPEASMLTTRPPKPSIYPVRTSLLDIYHPDPWHAPVAATTVFSTPDDGRKKRPKHVD